ncbi:hypothetical protein [Lysobacter sp. Root667]|uniref:hypothetical protein n=1 Tax=Lysobacter sp. Root667 TaxID=1736581 RepID=UPI0012DDCE7A|nr:hypothetical protein [Lysobacter sp. Root667]
MHRVDPPSQESADLEAALRRQLRWIEDDVATALLGPAAAPADAGEQRPDIAAAPGAHTMLARLRDRSAALLRRLLRRP